MPLLEVKKLETHYFTRMGIAQAVSDVSLDVNDNEFLGVVGESGCGKSTLAYSILNLIPEPGRIVSGQILFKGTDLLKLDEKSMSKIRWKDISMIFQQSMNALNPVVKVGDQIKEAIMIHEKNIHRPHIQEELINKVKDLFNQVGLDSRFIQSYPFELSGGMKQRVMIAMALACEPSLIIADEPTTALDVTIKAQIMDLMKTLRKKYNLSLMMISHDLSVVAETCDEVAVMYGGKIVEKGDVISIFKNPGHPYTKLLIGAIPSMERGKTKKLTSIPGKPRNLINPPPGCRFSDRCPYVQDICEKIYPRPEEHQNIACHFVDELRGVSIG